MVRVKGITLKVRRGRNNVYTEAVRTLRTGKDGSYAVKGLEAGNYCLEMVCGAESGYIPSYFNIVVLGNETVRNQNGVLSSKLSENQVRIVLTWGGRNPRIWTRICFSCCRRGAADMSIARIRSFGQREK